MSPRILFVFTSAETSKSGGPTGWYLPEAAHPYYELAPYFDIDFAAPKGPNPPLDPSSIEAYGKEELSAKFLNDPVATTKLANAKKLTEVKASDYIAVYYPGGVGPTLDLPQDPVNIALGNEFYRSGKIVSAVCHGPAALVGVTDASGKSIFAGQPVAGFSNEEEEKLGTTKAVGFSLEDKIKELGGKYEKGAEPFASYVVVAGKLITGQNPASSLDLGKKLLVALGVN